MLTWYKERVRARETKLDSAKDVPPSDEKREEAVVEPQANLAASHTAILGKPGKAVCCVSCVCGCAIVAD